MANTTAPVIRFVNAIPAPQRGRNKITQSQRIALALKMNPNKWGIIKQTKSVNSASNLVNIINQGKNSAYAPKGAFKAAQRKNSSGTISVYVKYLGEPIV